MGVSVVGFICNSDTGHLFLPKNTQGRKAMPLLMSLSLTQSPCRDCPVGLAAWEGFFNFLTGFEKQPLELLLHKNLLGLKTAGPFRVLPSFSLAVTSLYLTQNQGRVHCSLTHCLRHRQSLRGKNLVEFNSDSSKLFLVETKGFWAPLPVRRAQSLTGSLSQLPLIRFQIKAEGPTPAVPGLYWRAPLWAMLGWIVSFLRDHGCD